VQDNSPQVTRHKSQYIAPSDHTRRRPLGLNKTCIERAPPQTEGCRSVAWLRSLNFCSKMFSPLTEIVNLRPCFLLLIQRWLSRYIDKLGFDRAGFEPRLGVRFPRPFQTIPETYSASCEMGDGHGPGVKWPGPDVDHTSSRFKVHMVLTIDVSSIIAR
jgi:hypothetical protein